jgi:hypothetical protein
MEFATQVTIKQDGLLTLGYPKGHTLLNEFKSEDENPLCDPFFFKSGDCPIAFLSGPGAVST